MQFWADGLIFNLLLLATLLAGAAMVRRAVPAMQRLAVPDGLVAGIFGFLLGPSLLGLLPFDPQSLEVLVYHGLALVFIAVGLQSPVGVKATAGARSLAFAMPTMAVLQALLGLSVVIGWWALSSSTLHPGFGLLLPLGFQQGPGQALAIGNSWEGFGLPDGGQIGLVFAASGFLYCCLIGVPLVAWGRRHGLAGTADHPTPAQTPATPVVRSDPHGTMEALTRQAVTIAAVYLAVYLALRQVTGWLPAREAGMLWGLHFIVGAGFALLARRIIGHVPVPVLDDDLLGRIAAMVVEFTTAAALSAVQLQVLERWAGAIVLVTLGGAVLTAAIALWIGRRAFPDAPFQHVVVLFGASTGTLPTGLALLRMLDPELRGPVARNVVLATPGAVVLALPLLLVIMPLPVRGWPEGFPGDTLIAMGMLTVYVVLAVSAWRWVGPLRWLRPWGRIWPDRADADATGPGP